MEQFLLFAIAALDIELQANMLARASAANVLHQLEVTFENAVDLVGDLVEAAAGHLISGHQQLEVERFFQMAEQELRQQHQSRGEGCGEVKAAAGGHSNRSDHEQSGGRGQARGEAAVVKNGAGADETDSGDNLRGDSSGVRGNARELSRKQRKHSRAETDEHVGTQAGGAVFELTFEDKDATEKRR